MALMENWGTLAPEGLGSLRRQQDLGLGGAVRHYNDRSVPGLGGLWYPMPLVWSVLAIAQAERLKRNAIPVGNAIEALAMHGVRGASSNRMRGARKLQSVEDTSFANLSRWGVYVTQPVRMAMVQPMVSLGFAQGTRYGGFTLADAGRKMLDLPSVAGWHKAMTAWTAGGMPRKGVVAALSPDAALPLEVRKLIERYLLEGHKPGDPAAARRRALVALGTGPTVTQLEGSAPLDGLAADHVMDLRAGAAFMDLRDCALHLLRAVEGKLLERRDQNLPTRLPVAEAVSRLGDELAKLRRVAEANAARILAGAERDSMRFLRECLDLDEADLLRKLAGRDSSVICLRGDDLVAGPAASDLRGYVTSDETVLPEAESAFAPQLYRLANLNAVIRELRGETNPITSDEAEGAA